MAIKVITDSSCDIPQDIIEAYGIIVIPLTVSFGNRHFKSGVDIDNRTFYTMMREGEDFPRSASPAPNVFMQAFDDHPEDDIVVLSLSAGLSSTYDNAVIAKNMYLEDHPKRNIEVFNTRSASAGLALMVYETAKQIANGDTFEQVVAAVHKRIDDIATVFVLDTLENVVKGGRLDRVRGAIAKTLNIKLLMRDNEEGTLEVIEKVRGNKKALRRFVEQIGEYGKNFEDKVVALAHSNCEEKAQKVLDEILEMYPFKEAIIAEVGPLIGTYAGEGGLIVAYRTE